MEGRQTDMLGPPASQRALAENRSRTMEYRSEAMGLCPSCSRFVPATAVPSDTKLCCECSLCGIGCFGRKKRHRAKYLIQAHGEMVTAVSNVSQVNATLLERISSAEEKSRHLEIKFSQMEQEILYKEGQCKSSEVTIENTKKDNVTLKKELAALKQEKTHVDEECHKLRLAINDHKETAEKANSELASVKAALDTACNNLEKTTDSKIQLTSEKQTLVSKVNTLQSELDVALKKKHELADQVDNHAAYREKTDTEMNKLRLLVTELKEEKIKAEKDHLCNTNYLQRELLKMAERFKRRQRMVERLTAEKENLLVTFRQRAYDTDGHSWHRRHDTQMGAPEAQSPVPKASTHDEHLNTKILELQLKLDRQDGMVRALEDRIQFHEPDFTVNTDEEIAPFRDDAGATTKHNVSRSHPELTTVQELNPTKNMKSYFDDSGIEAEKLKLEDVTPDFTSTPKKAPVKKLPQSPE